MFYQTMCILKYLRDIRDPLESHRSEGNEILVVKNDIVQKIAPGEGKEVESWLNRNCKYVKFVHKQKVWNGTTS